MTRPEHNLPFAAVSLDAILPHPDLLDAARRYRDRQNALDAMRHHFGSWAVAERVRLADEVDEAGYMLDCAIEAEMRRRHADSG